MTSKTDQLEEMPTNQESLEGTSNKENLSHLDFVRYGALSALQEFSINTTAHGIPRIVSSKHIFNRIFWTISFLAYTGVMIFFVTQSIIDYFRYPTQTIISATVERSQPFPAVTICNNGITRYDQGIAEFVNYTNSLNLTNTTVDSTFTEEQAGYLLQYLVYKINHGLPIDYLFFPLDLMMIECTYNEITCRSSDFISFDSATYGRCYTFNAQIKNSTSAKIRMTNDNGSTGKLQIRLYAYSHLYFPHFRDDLYSGFAVAIHDNTELPYRDISAMHLSYGKIHKLAYTKRVRRFLPPPYTQCTEKISLAMAATFKQFNEAEYVYSQGLCNVLCTQAYVYQECGCISPLHWSAKFVVLPGTDTVTEVPLCYPSNECFKTASSRLTGSNILWEKHCSHCQQACSTTEFSVTPTGASTIASNFVWEVKTFVESKGAPPPPNWETNWPLLIYADYFAFEVVPQSDLVETLTQEAAITSTDLLGNVGGHTGLWIGISFLSLMEVIEMLCHIFHIIFITLLRRFKKDR